MNRRGFTIIEMLLCLLVTGVVAGGVVWGFGKVQDNAQRTTAISKAKLIDASRSLYAGDVPDEGEWSPLDTAGRINLLITKNYLGGSATDYTTLQGNYSLSLSGGIRSKTIVKQGESQIVP